MTNPLYNYGLPTTVTGSGTAAVTTGEVENGGSNGGSAHTPPANTATVSVPGGSPSEEMVGLNTPVLSTIAPTTAVHGAANATVTCTGTGFRSGVTVARVDAVPQTTTYVSPTSVTYQGQHLAQAIAATVQVTVANLGISSAQKPFIYT